MLQKDKFRRCIRIFLAMAVISAGLFIIKPTYAASNKVTLVLHYRNGKVYQKKVVKKGSRVKLPGMIPRKGYTFMGWSRTKTSTDPQYTTGRYIRVNTDTHLYAVMFNRNNEANVSNATLKAKQLQALKKYSQIIFVGDSRTFQFKKRVKAEKNVKFVAKIGATLNDLKRSQFRQVYSLVKKKAKASRPTAIIVNLGVNDIYSKKAYVAYYRSMSRRLKNCKFYFMSVNPTNEKSMLKVKHYSRSDSSIRSFNNYLKKNLSGKYTYLDCYSYLLETGYGTASGFGANDGKRDDGLHYTRKTSRRIFEFCLDQLINN